MPLPCANLKTVSHSPPTHRQGFFSLFPPGQLVLVITRKEKGPAQLGLGPREFNGEDGQPWPPKKTPTDTTMMSQPPCILSVRDQSGLSASHMIVRSTVFPGRILHLIILQPQLDPLSGLAGTNRLIWPQVTSIFSSVSSTALNHYTAWACSAVLDLGSSIPPDILVQPRESKSVSV